MYLRDLVRDEEHEEIARLEGAEFYPFKTVACIQVGRFSEALRYAAKGSFEQAYILYKLKKYKRALRILRNMNTEGSAVLSSQCLYYLGYYNNAYKMLSKIKKDDDVVVNLQAMKSLAVLAQRSQQMFGSKFALRAMDEPVEFEDLDKYRPKCAEGHVDFVFNLSFSHLSNEKKFVGFLEERVGSDSRLKGTVVEGQLRNIKGLYGDIDMSNLSKNQREVVEFNTGAIGQLSNPLHFQQNFMGFDRGCAAARHSECLWIEELYNSSFKTKFDEIPPLSPKMVLFRILVLYKNGYAAGPGLLRKTSDRMVSSWLKAVVDFLRAVEDGAKLDRDSYIRMLSGVSDGTVPDGVDIHP